MDPDPGGVPPKDEYEVRGVIRDAVHTMGCHMIVASTIQGEPTRLNDTSCFARSPCVWPRRAPAVSFTTQASSSACPAPQPCTPGAAHAPHWTTAPVRP